MKLKICGIRNIEMLSACQAGAVDYVGINFVSTSKRRVQLPLKKSPNEIFKRVGIFVDPDIADIKLATQNYGLEVIQLHGNESLEFIDKCLEEFPSTKVWKALSVGKNLKMEVLRQYCNKCELVLFDGKKPGSGNTILDQEKLCDAILQTQANGTKVGLAGGINTNNIGNFKKKFPDIYLLDTASGVEREGHFSTTELQQLIHNFNA